MFTADPSMRCPFIENEIIHYKRLVELVPIDRPMILVAPTFMSTKNATDLLSNIIPIRPEDQADWRKALRYEAYFNSCWVDAPTVTIAMICKSGYRPIREYRVQTDAHRIFLTELGKRDIPMVVHEERKDYDQVLRWRNTIQPGERMQVHQTLNARSKLQHMLQLNQLQHSRDDVPTYSWGTNFGNKYDTKWKDDENYFQKIPGKI